MKNIVDNNRMLLLFGAKYRTIALIFSFPASCVPFQQRRMKKKSHPSTVLDRHERVAGVFDRWGLSPSTRGLTVKEVNRIPPRCRTMSETPLVLLSGRNKITWVWLLRDEESTHGKVEWHRSIKNIILRFTSPISFIVVYLRWNDWWGDKSAWMNDESESVAVDIRWNCVSSSIVSWAAIKRVERP